MKLSAEKCSPENNLKPWHIYRQLDYEVVIMKPDCEVFLFSLFK